MQKILLTTLMEVLIQDQETVMPLILKTTHLLGRAFEKTTDMSKTTNNIMLMHI